MTQVLYGERIGKQGKIRLGCSAGGGFQIVALHFEAEITGGEPGLSNETSGVGYFTLQEIEVLEMFGRHKERIIDTLEKRADAFIR